MLIWRTQLNNYHKCVSSLFNKIKEVNNSISILKYVVDTGTLLYLAFEEKNISYPLCLLLLIFVRYLHHPNHILIQKSRHTKKKTLIENKVTKIDKFNTLRERNQPKSDTFNPIPIPKLVPSIA